MVDCKCPERCWCSKGRKRYDAERWKSRDKTAWKLRKSQHREETLRWYREQKEYPCCDCGIEYHFAAMQFDHRPGTDKVDDPSRLASDGRRKKLEAEISKCELRCANCHAILTFERREQGVV